MMIAAPNQSRTLPRETEDRMSTNERNYFAKEELNAFDSALLAQWISFGPVIFQAAKALRDMGILKAVYDTKKQGLTLQEAVDATGHSEYAVRVLLEAGLGMKLVTQSEDDRYRATKVAWYILNDALTQVNMDFTHDVSYLGTFHLQEALKEGRPAGLHVLGDWPTIYEGLSKLEPNVAKSWFDFDHFYSDGAFSDALPHLFAEKPRTLLDVGGNTGKFSRRAAAFDADVKITIADLPGQVGMATKNIQEWGLEGRVSFHPVNLLNPNAKLPTGQDAIWMSQFLCCFSEDEIVSILNRCREALSERGRIYILDTFWDRQRSIGGAFCLQQTSLYFTAMANGNSQMYDSKVFVRLIERAGLEVEKMVDDLGESHTIIQCRVKG
jgi:hypothetical protein